MGDNGGKNGGKEGNLDSNTRHNRRSGRLDCQKADNLEKKKHNSYMLQHIEDKH